MISSMSLLSAFHGNFDKVGCSYNMRPDIGVRGSMGMTSKRGHAIYPPHDSRLA
jgi:hypothetical protein